MNRREQIGGLFWLGISVFVCVESWRTDIGSLHVPGPGFLPFWAAVVLGLFAITMLISGTFKKRLGRLTDLWKGLQWQRIIWLLCALFVYPLVFLPLGYLYAPTIQNNRDPAPLMLAFVLGPMLETNLRQSLLVSNGSFLIFFTRSISVVFMAATILILISSVFPYFKKRKQEYGGSTRDD